MYLTTPTPKRDMYLTTACWFVAYVLLNVVLSERCWKISRCSTLFVFFLCSSFCVLPGGCDVFRFLWFPCGFFWFLIVFVWFPYVLLWLTYGFLCFCCGLLMGGFGFLMVSLWIPVVSFSFYHGFLWCSSIVLWFLIFF